MSILNIKERFSKRILESEKEVEESKNIQNSNGIEKGNYVDYSILETDVGITEYLSKTEGFHAIIKQRFSDFNVHEIDLDGNTVTLNSYELPDESLGSEVLKIDILEQSILDNLEKLASSDGDVENVDIDVTHNTKEERKSIHQYIKGKYGSDVTSNTSDIGEKKIITITKAENGSGDSRRAGHLPKHLHFVLSKSNMDTNSALNLLSTKLRMKAKNFNVAGTKDKRANTTQQVSIKNCYAAQLKDIKGLRNLWLGNYSYKDTGLSLGQLKGNNFQIALRDVLVSDEVINDGFEKLKENGFVNYFGLQRFGNCRESPTHEVGKCLVKEAYGQAVDLILKPRPGVEAPDIRQARDIWIKTKDAVKALGACRGTRTIEAKLLQGLKINGNTAFINALDNVPRNIRLLYLHSFQSYIWNKVVSRRIATHGLKLLEGDLVYKTEEAEHECDEPEPENDVENAADAVEETTKKIGDVELITAENFDKYTIYDILLPLPGHAILYPKNETASYYQQLLEEDGLTIDSFNCNEKKYALGGNYRKMVIKPKNLSWRVVRYNRVEDDLILSDADILGGKELKENDGDYRAVIVNIDLASSTYATMALREVLKADTSSQHQSELNNRAKRQAEFENGSDEAEKKLKLDCS